MKEELVWISGVVANTSARDIGKSIIAKYPILRLAAKAVWREFSVSAGLEGLDVASTMQSESDVEIVWNILRPLESIHFSALIGTSDKEFASELREGHGLEVLARIENTDCAFEGVLSRASIGDARSTLLGAILFFVLAIVAIWTLVTGSYREYTPGLISAARPTVLFDLENVDDVNKRFLIVNHNDSSDQSWVSNSEFSHMKTTLIATSKVKTLLRQILLGLLGLISVLVFWVLTAEFPRALRRYRYLNAGARSSDLLLKWSQK